MSRIAYRFYNDGDMVNIAYGKETCNPAARFLIAKGNAEVSSLTAGLWRSSARTPTKRSWTSFAER